MNARTRGYLLVSLTVILSTISELFLKHGASLTASRHDLIPFLGFTALASPWVWLGIVLQIIGLASYSAALRTLPLYIAFSITAAFHATIPLGSWLFLGETMNALRVVGICVVLVGVTIIAKPASEAEEKVERKV